MSDITDAPEYRLGWEWAREHGPMLAELFTGRDVSTPELRKRLFQEAARRWPSERDDVANDLRQTAFVAGALKAAVETLPLSQEGAAATFDAALEMGVMWSSEQAKVRALEALKEKPSGWWRRKLGDARPLDVVNALSVAWRHDWAKERGRPHPGSKWAVLIDTLGPRELDTFAEVDRIERKVSGYPVYVVHGDGETFTLIAAPVFEGGRLHRYPGELVG